MTNAVNQNGTPKASNRKICNTLTTKYNLAVAPIALETMKNKEPILCASTLILIAFPSQLPLSFVTLSPEVILLKVLVLLFPVRFLQPLLLLRPRLLLLARTIRLGLALPLQGVSLDFHNWCSPTFLGCTDVTVFRLAMHTLGLIANYGLTKFADLVRDCHF